MTTGDTTAAYTSNNRHRLEVAHGWHEEAGVLEAEGRLDEAAALYERALSLKRTVHGPNHADVAATLHNLAVLRERMGHAEEAGALWAEARRMLEAPP
jgi:tetratricopeptide (TPR) repeat protein